jgi:F0F1-type ATP synthase delta subunit
MIHTSRQYAESLFGALEHKAPEARREILKNLLRVLDKNHDSSLLKRILIDFEKVTLHKEGMRKVEVESVSPLSEQVKKDIQATLGSDVVITEKINEELVAGMTILVDDSLFIDASARAQINSIF